MSGYYKIARHYNYSINHVLNTLNYDAIIITEGNRWTWQRSETRFIVCMVRRFGNLTGLSRLLPRVVSPDARRQKSLVCLSLEWQRHRSKDRSWSKWDERWTSLMVSSFYVALLHRSDFFPGLGWLLTRTIWNEIKGSWPAAWATGERGGFCHVEYRIDFGMIGCDCRNNDEIAFVFDRRSLVRLYRSKGRKALVSKSMPRTAMLIHRHFLPEDNTTNVIWRKLSKTPNPWIGNRSIYAICSR